MNIIQMPAELQEAVLYHLDGSSLAKAQRVCKLWKNCVDNLAKVKNIWCDKCIQEIPAGTLLLLVGGTPCKTAGTWELWRALYQRWYRSRCVKSWGVQTVWQQRHFTQSNASDRSIAKQANLLQFCGDEVVLFEWTEIVRWHIATGERLAPRDCVVAMGAMSKKYLVVLNPLIIPEKDCKISDKCYDVMYPCLLIGIGNMLFFFTKAGMKSIQLPHFITCLAVWSRTLIIGWNTGAVDLYTLPDDLVNFDRSQLLQNPHHLVPALFNNWQGGFFPQNTMHATGAIIVGNRAFLIRAPNLEVWDLDKKLFLTSEFYGSMHVRKMVANGSMIFCLTGSVLNWFEWSEETVELLPGQTPESVPVNITCIAMYGDLLALGTSEGLIYMYHLNRTTIQENSKVDSSESSDEDSSTPHANQYSWDPVLSFKRMSISRTQNMIMVESALRNPIRTICVAGCDYVEAVAISDNGQGPMVAAIGVKTDEAWVQQVHLFSWS